VSEEEASGGRSWILDAFQIYGLTAQVDTWGRFNSIKIASNGRDRLNLVNPKIYENQLEFFVI
jgi:hypothetical protein